MQLNLWFIFDKEVTLALRQHFKSLPSIVASCTSTKCYTKPVVFWKIFYQQNKKDEKCFSISRKNTLDCSIQVFESYKVLWCCRNVIGMIFRFPNILSHLKINFLKTIWSFKMKSSSFKCIKPLEVKCKIKKYVME